MIVMQGVTKVVCVDGCNTESDGEGNERLPRHMCSVGEKTRILCLGANVAEN